MTRTLMVLKGKTSPETRLSTADLQVKKTKKQTSSTSRLKTATSVENPSLSSDCDRMSFTQLPTPQTSDGLQISRSNAAPSGSSRTSLVRLHAQTSLISSRGIDEAITQNCKSRHNKKLYFITDTALLYNRESKRAISRFPLPRAVQTRRSSFDVLQSNATSAPTPASASLKSQFVTTRSKVSIFSVCPLRWW